MAKISFGEIPTKVKGFGAVLALGATAFGLSACGGSAEANGPSPTPTSIESVEPTPTVEPTETTPTVAETGFQGVVDYAAFENWETLTEEQKTSVLMEFLDANPLDTDVIPSPNMNDRQVTEWYKKATDTVFSLALDKTDPNNYEVAQKLIEQLTMDRQNGQFPGNGARGAALENLKTAYYNTFDDPIVMDTIDPAHIRVSTGFFVAEAGFLATIIKGGSVAMPSAELSEIFMLELTPDGRWIPVALLITPNTTGDISPLGAPPLRDLTANQ